MIIKFLFILVFTFVIFMLVKKYAFLNNFTGEKHQIFLDSKKVPLVGGLIFFFSLIVNFDFGYLNYYFFLSLIFLLGFFSDLKKISSPILKFILQFIIVFFFINLLSLKVEPLNIYFLDIFLGVYDFNLLFTSLCILIVINGTNFLDGLNNLVIGYYIIIICLLKYLDNQGFLINSIFEIDSILFTLIILFIFNFFNKVYLGDSGAYLLSIVFSIILIDFYNNNSDLISPFFIVLLLWYPAFENFFSILRKINFNLSPVKPDTFHFHQQIYKFLYLKFKKKAVFTNTLTGNLINLYNCLLFLIGIQKINSNFLQIFLVMISVVLYVVFYIRFSKKNY